ncbi:septal ring lytic transglycosylase RlpA family protein [Phenylobacterium sp. LjRoot219]|uniref:septal ring lytic transglycosylase RlpA family protein n=1 Tax=Phenylobacterium sp. LjRoot219 TaxID=3342283 RepID=UPI003ED11945
MALIAVAAGSLAACATVDRTPPAKPSASGYKVGKPYQVGGVWYVPREQPDYDKVGMASWYGDAFHLKSTANGEIFDMNALTAAHTTLPLPSIVEVTNLANGRKLRVRVNDRGPFVDNRIIDLSRESARQLGLERQGVARVRVRYVGPAPLLGRDAGVRVARARPAAPQPVQTARAAPAAPGAGADLPGSAL